MGLKYIIAIFFSALQSIMSAVYHNVILSLTLLITGCVVKPEKVRFDNHPPITSNSIQSQHYELVHVMSGGLCDLLMDWERYGLYYNEKTSETLVKSVYYYKEGEKLQEGSFFMRINHRGKVAGQLTSPTPFHPTKNGVVFKETYYNDWVHTGDDTQRPYKSILNQDDQYSPVEWENQFKQLYASAQEVYYTTASMKHCSVCYFNDGENWHVLYCPTSDSATRFKTVPEGEAILADYPNYPQKTIFRFIALENYFKKKPFYKWTEAGQRIYLEDFRRTSYQPSSFIPTDIPGPRAGFHGKGAYTLCHQNEILRFTAYAFKHKDSGFRFNTDMGLFSLPPSAKGSEDLLFLNLFIGRGTKRPREEAGLYVMRPKN